MATITPIEWAKTVIDGEEHLGRSWNILRGCKYKSPGCFNCYAQRIAGRFDKPGLAFEGLTKKVKGKTWWSGQIRLIKKALDEPFSWKKPCKVFVNSMSDLFLDEVPFEFIDEIFQVMACADWHTYIILTKRPARMLEYFKWVESRWTEDGWLHLGGNKDVSIGRDAWPLSNVWLGVSVEDQEAADKRIPLLLETPATVKFLSCEPLLGHINLFKYVEPSDEDWEETHLLFEDSEPEDFVQENEYEGDYINFGADLIYNPDHFEWEKDKKRHAYGLALGRKLDWIIVGGESGPGYRSLGLNDARAIRNQAQQAGIPFFLKQIGGSTPKAGGDLLDGNQYHEFPEV